VSTRGVYGFRVDCVDKLSYNHSDSYPEWLGERIFKETRRLIKKWDRTDLVNAVRAIKMVKNEKPSPELVAATRKYHNLSVSSGSIDDSYCLFREAQGSLNAALDIGYMLDGHKFIKDSLFCEWGYIVNLDTWMLEVWRGFQHTADRENRYGTKPYESAGGYDYYPCKRILEVNLSTIACGAVTKESFVETLQELTREE
jgi:hypothetical protein